jgi:hypothetical protein
MADWKWLAEKRIREAIEDGHMSHLAGEGKPLQLDDDPNTPQDLKLAYKILRDNGLAPEWMMMGRELDEQRARLLANVRRGVRAYQGALGDAGRIADPLRSAERRQRIDAAWQTARDTFCEAAAGFNRQVTSYNLKVPTGISHKPYLDIEREINRMLGLERKG